MPVGLLSFGSNPFFKTVQNVGTLGGDQHNFINFAKSAQPALGSNSATVLNDDSYPSSSLTHNLGMNFTLDPRMSADTFVLKWTGTVAVDNWTFNTGLNTVAADNSGGRTSVNSGNSFRGNNARFTFKFDSLPVGTNSLSTYFNAACTFSGFGSVVLCRLSDEAAVDGGAIWNPYWIASINDLNPGVLRFMGPTLTYGSESVSSGRWESRYPLTAFSYINTRPYVSGLWCGGAGSSGAIAKSGNLYTAPAHDDMPLTYEDGENWMGVVSATPSSSSVASVFNSSGKIGLRFTGAIPSGLSTNDPISYTGYTVAAGGSYGVGLWKVTVLNSTDLELTTNWSSGVASVFVTYSSSPGTVGVARINSGGRGVLPLYGISVPISAVGIDHTAESGRTVFLYNRLLNAVCAAPGGLNPGMSPELCVSACNATNKHYWMNLTQYASDDHAIKAITYVRNNLNTSLLFEPTNEPWNFGFPQFYHGWYCGVALNIGSSPQLDSSIVSWTYHGLRSAQLFDIVRPIWEATRPRAQFHTVMTNWAVNSFVANFDTYRMQGNLLNASTNAVLSAWTGGQRYDQGSPNFNRPVDKTTVVSFAPYAYINDSNYTATNFYQIAQNYATGNTTAALDAISTAMGNSIGGYNNPASPEPIYSTYEALLAGYDSQRPAGMGPLELWCYEGWHEFEFPHVSEYVSNGASVSSTVTFDIPGSKVLWTAHGLANGCRVNFSGGTLPSGIGPSSTATNEYLVFNAGVNDFQLHPVTTPPIYLATTPIILGGSSSGTITATAGQYSFDNAMIGWLQDPTRTSVWTNKVLNEFGNTARYPHFRRMAMLQLEGWESFFAGEWRAWSLYPAGMETTPFKVFDAIKAFNARARN